MKSVHKSYTFYLVSKCVNLFQYKTLFQYKRAVFPAHSIYKYNLYYTMTLFSHSESLDDTHDT